MSAVQESAPAFYTCFTCSAPIPGSPKHFRIWPGAQDDSGVDFFCESHAPAVKEAGASCSECDQPAIAFGYCAAHDPFADE